MDYYAKVHFWISCKFATHITTISKETKDRISELTNANLKILYPGVSRNIRYYKRVKPFKNIGYIGTYNARKRVHLFLDLVKVLGVQNKNYKFFFAGRISQEFEQAFVELCKPYKKIDYKFLGKIDESKKNDFYSHIDILFYPTELEGFGIPIIEARFSGATPVILNDANIPKVTRDLAISIKSVHDFNPEELMSVSEATINRSKYDYSEFYKFISFILCKC